MASSSLYDPFRELFVKGTPEETVRQRYLDLLTNELGFPASLIAVEKSLRELVKDARPPSRRVDILCFEPSGRPLLLIECKAVPLTKAMQRQVRGYNYFVKAPFIALVNNEEALFAEAAGSFTSGIRPFAECMSHA